VLKGGGVLRAEKLRAFKTGSGHEPVLKGGLIFGLRGLAGTAPPLTAVRRGTAVKGRLALQQKASFPLV